MRSGPLQESIVECPACDGEGRIDVERGGTIEGGPRWATVGCGNCLGSGSVRECAECSECGEELLVGESGACSECLAEAQRGRAAC